MGFCDVRGEILFGFGIINRTGHCDVYFYYFAKQESHSREYVLKALDREQDWMKREVKEAIHIKQRAPSMNRDQGYQLPPIYGQIIPRPPPSEPNHPPWSLRDQNLLMAVLNVAIVSH